MAERRAVYNQVTELTNRIKTRPASRDGPLTLRCPRRATLEDDTITLCTGWWTTLWTERASADGRWPVDSRSRPRTLAGTTGRPPQSPHSRDTRLTCRSPVCPQRATARLRRQFLTPRRDYVWATQFFWTPSHAIRISGHWADGDAAGPRRGSCTMKFRVERDDLADAVAWTARTLPARPTTQSRSSPACCSRRAASGCGCPASTTRSQPAARCRRPCSRAGRALVTGRLLAEITRSLPGGAGRHRRRRRRGSS